MSSTADRNLLVGIVALQMDFINREQLIAAMSAWVLDKGRALDDILLEQKALREDTHALLVAMVKKHVELHDDDPQISLAALSSIGSLRDELHSLGDVDVEGTLSQIAADGALGDPLTTLSLAGPSNAAGERFRILRPHARGGLGEVSIALDEELNREVALKEIQRQFADDAESRARFVVEAEVTGGLEHPGVVPVYGLGQYADGRPFYAMRFVKGDSLKESVDRFHKDDKPERDPGERTLQLRHVLGRFIDVCNAIEYAHSRGVLHRDLKPGNVMLGRYGETLVVDWGLAKVIGRPDEPTEVNETTLRPSSGSDSAPTQMGKAVGTPAYMSPEQAAGQLDKLGPASDVYGLGATLYYLLTGQPPFRDSDVGVVLRKVQHAEFPRPREVKPEVPRTLEAICLKAMQTDARRRYDAPASLAVDIEYWLADEPTSAYRDPPSVRLRRWMARHKVVVATTAVTLLLAAAIGPLVGLQQRRIANQTKKLADNQSKLAGQQTELAEQQTELANQQTEIANEQTRRAEQDRKSAAEQKQLRIEADEQRGLAEQREGEATKATSLAEQRLVTANMARYANQLKVAQARLDDARFSEAQRLLETCPWNLRGWEYRHLWTRLHTDFQALQAHKDNIFSVAWSPDGSRFATTSTGDPRNHQTPGQVIVWNAATRKAVRHYRGHKGWVSSVAFDATGERIVTASWDETAIVWNVESGEQLAVFSGHPGYVHQAAFSPDGRVVASAGWDNTVRVWDARTAEPIHVLHGHTAPVTAIAFSPSGEFIASDGRDTDVRVWDAETGDLHRTLPGTSQMTNSVSFSPDGTQLAAVAKNSVHIWDLESGKQLRSLATPVRWLGTVRFAASGNRLAAAGDNTIVVWDGASGSELQTIEIATRTIETLAFSTNGRRLLCGGATGEVHLLDLSTTTEPHRFDRRGSTVTSTAIHPDGDLVAVASEDGVVRLQVARTGETVREFPNQGVVLTVSFSHDGEWLACGTRERSAIIFDCTTGKQLRKIETDHEVAEVYFSHDRRRLATVEVQHSSFGRIVAHPAVWDLHNGEKQFELELNPDADADPRRSLSPTRRVRSLRFSHDGKHLAGGVGKSVYLWDGESGKFVFRIGGIHGDVWCLAFSPDDKWIARGTLGVVTAPGPTKIPGQVGVIELPGRQAIAKIRRGSLADLPGHKMNMNGHTDRIQGVAFSPNGQRIASASLDGTVRVWDPLTGQQLLQLPTGPFGLRAIFFSRDGKQLTCAKHAIGDVERRRFRVRVFDASSGETLMTLPGHLDPVQSMQFSRDERLLASIDQSGTARLWDLESGAERLTFRRTDQDNLSLEISPDSTRVALATNGGQVQVWTIANGCFQTIEFSADVKIEWRGNRLFCWTSDDSVAVWDATVGEVVFRGAAKDFDEGEGEEPPRPALAPVEAHDWELVPTDPPKRGMPAPLLGQVVLRHLETGKLRTIATNGHGVARLSAEGSLLAVADEAGIRTRDGLLHHWGDYVETLVWNARTNDSLRSLHGHEKDVRAVAFSPGGTRLVTGGYDRKLAFWDVIAGNYELAYRRFPIAGLTFSPDGVTVAYQTDDHRVFVSNVPPPGTIPKITQVYGDESSSFATMSFGIGSVQGKQLDFSPDGQRLVFGNDRREVVASFLGSVPLAVTFGEHGSRIDGALFSHSGEYVVSFGDDEVRVWNGESGELLQRLPADKILAADESDFPRDSARSHIVAACLSADDRTLVTVAQLSRFAEGSFNSRNVVGCWDLVRGELRRVFPAMPGAIKGAAISPDGKWIACVGGVSNIDVEQPGQVVLFDYDSGIEVARVKGKFRLAIGVAFDPIRPRLAFSTYDGQVRVWEYEQSVAERIE